MFTNACCPYAYVCLSFRKAPGGPFPGLIGSLPGTSSIEEPLLSEIIHFVQWVSHYTLLFCILSLLEFINCKGIFIYFNLSTDSVGCGFHRDLETIAGVLLWDPKTAKPMFQEQS